MWAMSPLTHMVMKSHKHLNTYIMYWNFKDLVLILSVVAPMQHFFLIYLICM